LVKFVILIISYNPFLDNAIHIVMGSFGRALFPATEDKILKMTLVRQESSRKYMNFST